MSRWLHEFLKLAAPEVTADNPDLLVEVLGLFAVFENVPGTPWGELCELGLIETLHRLLVLGFSDDDIVLEAVMLVGVLAVDDEAVQHLAMQGKFLTVLTELLLEKQDDDDIVLSVEDSQLISHVIDALQHKSSLVKEQARKTLDTFSLLKLSSSPTSQDADVEGSRWQERIKALKFDVHNSAWLLEVRNLDYREGGGSFMSDHHYDRENDNDNSTSPRPWEVEASLGIMDGLGDGVGNAFLGGSLGGGLQWDVEAVLAERDWSYD
eukprot:g17592.t1